MEGEGTLGGSYKIDGYAQISHKTFGSGKFVEWYLTIGVSGATAAKLSGDVSWFGTTKLSVGGAITDTKYFKDENLNSEELNNSLSSYVGSVTFILPNTTLSVQAIVNVCYVFENEQGRGGSPSPTITHTISILH